MKQCTVLTQQVIIRIGFNSESVFKELAMELSCIEKRLLNRPKASNHRENKDKNRTVANKCVLLYISLPFGILSSLT